MSRWVNIRMAVDNEENRQASSPRAFICVLMGRFGSTHGSFGHYGFLRVKYYHLTSLFDFAASRPTQKYSLLLRLSTERCVQWRYNTLFVYYLELHHIDASAHPSKFGDILVFAPKLRLLGLNTCLAITYQCRKILSTR